MKLKSTNLAFVFVCYFVSAIFFSPNTSTVNSQIKLIKLKEDIDFSWHLGSRTTSNIDASQIINDLSQQGDFLVSDMPGRLELPVQHQLIEIPAGTDPEIEILVHKTEHQPLSSPIPIAPAPAGVLRSPDGELLGGAFEPTAQVVYEIPPIISVEDVGIMAGVRYGRITFFPVVPTQNHKHALVTTELQAKIYFAPQFQSAPESANIDLGAQTITPEIMIEVAEKGIVVLGYQELADSGLPIDNKSPQNWELYKNGEAISMHFIGDDDAIFEENERFLFYNDAPFSRWVKIDTFTLSHVTQAGLRMEDSQPSANVSAAATLTQIKQLEEDLLYTPNCFCGALPAGYNGDRWTWKELKSPGSDSTTIPFSLEGFDPNSSAEITINLIGFTELATDNDHGLAVALNNQNIGNIIWDGKTAHAQTLTIPPGTLNANNDLVLTLDQGAGAIDGVWLDAIQITYSKSDNQLALGNQTIFDAFSTNGKLTLQPTSATKLWGLNVSDSTNPEIVVAGISTEQSFTLNMSANTKKTFAFGFENDLIQPLNVRTPHDLSNTEGDYIIIAPNELHSGLSDLINLRSSQGLTVVLASIEGIYDQVGGGNPTPDSIHAYLQQAYNSWSIRPKFVLLVGDGTYDPKLNLDNSKPSILPVYFANVDPWAGEIASDNRYAMLEGDDPLPDVAIGRLPVNSAEELAIVIDKLVHYPTNNLAWRNNITFIADNTDTAGDFTIMGRTIGNLIESTRYNMSKFEVDGEAENLSFIKNGVLNNWGAGQGHLVYAGHSTVHQWADEEIIHISQVQDLRNKSKQPIVLQMTCFTGSYQMPGLDSFDETMVRHENGGGIAVWGSTGLGVATGHDSLIEGYFETLKENETTQIGEAILAGKLNLVTHSPSNLDLLDTFTLLGDPALIISPPQDFINTYLPVIQRAP